jgi:hypothetical protein
VRTALLVVLALGALLRFAHIDFGLDRHDVQRALLHEQQDEEGLVKSVQETLLRGNVNPDTFLLWGTAGYYLFGLADALVLLPRALTTDGGWPAVMDAMDDNPSDLHLVQRCVSALASVLLILLVYRMARREAGATTGLLAAVLLATAYLPAREGHFGALDTLCALAVIAAVDRSLVLAADPRPRRYVQAGLCAGIAAATKYFGVVSALAVLAAHVFAWRATRRAGTAGAASPAPDAGPAPRLTGLLLAAAAAGAAFLVLSPHVIYAPAAWLDKLRFQQETIGARTDTASLLKVLGHHLQFTFLAGFGEIALPLAIVGGVLAWRAGGRLRLLVVCTLLLLPMFFIARSRAVRYGIAHVSLFAVLAALACDLLAALAGRWRGLVLALLLLLATGPSLVRIVTFDRALGRPDTRQLVLDYIARSGHPLSDMVAVGYYGLPRPRLTHHKVPYLDYLRVTISGMLPRAEGTRLRPYFLLRDHSSELVDERGWIDFEDMVQSEYRVGLHVDGRRDPAAVELPDPVAGSPAFLMPFTNPWMMERPGPPLTLYERMAP